LQIHIKLWIGSREENNEINITDFGSCPSPVAIGNRLRSDTESGFRK
jgi:hypothetical protein